MLSYSSRSIQAKFAAERNWEQYHTPRNLLLAMVSDYNKYGAVGVNSVRDIINTVL